MCDSINMTIFSWIFFFLAQLLIHESSNYFFFFVDHWNTFLTISIFGIIRMRLISSTVLILISVTELIILIQTFDVDFNCYRVSFLLIKFLNIYVILFNLFDQLDVVMIYLIIFIYLQWLLFVHILMLDFLVFRFIYFILLLNKRVSIFIFPFLLLSFFLMHHIIR